MALRLVPDSACRFHAPLCVCIWLFRKFQSVGPSSDHTCLSISAFHARSVVLMPAIVQLMRKFEGQFDPVRVSNWILGPLLLISFEMLCVFGLSRICIAICEPSLSQDMCTTRLFSVCLVCAPAASMLTSRHVHVASSEQALRGASGARSG